MFTKRYQASEQSSVAILRGSLWIIFTMKLANTGNVALVFDLLRSSIKSQWLVAWFVAAFSSALILVIQSAWALHKDPLLSETRWFARLAFVASMTHAALWGALVINVFPGLDIPRRHIIELVYAAMMSCGALGLYTVPIAAYGYLLTLTVTAVAALLLAPAPMSNVTVFLVLSFTVVIGVLVRNVGGVLLSAVRAERNSEEQRSMLAVTLRDFEGGAQDWLWTCDTSGVLVRDSSRMSEALGQTEGTIIGRNIVEMVGAERDPDSLRLASKLRERQPFSDLRVSLQTPVQPGSLSESGEAAGPVRFERRWWALSARPVHDRHGEFTGWQGVGRDITVAQRRSEALQRSSELDALTGLSNRRHILNRLDALESDLVSGLAISGVLVILDVDNFKTVNDTFGHSVGDQLLMVVSERLRKELPQDCVIGRLGGDEFCIVRRFDEAATGVTDTQAEQFGLQIQGILKPPSLIAGVRFDVRVSIGAALFPRDGLGAEDLLRHADAALYDAKASGRDSVRVFDREIEQLVLQRASVLAQLTGALQKSEFELEFFPYYRADGCCAAVEADIVWRKTEGTRIGSEEFLPLAEDSGIVIPIAAWHLRSACKTAQSWSNGEPVVVPVPRALATGNELVTVVTDALGYAQIQPGRLILEIDYDSIGGTQQKQRLSSLVNMGVRVIVSGYNLGRLGSGRDLHIGGLFVDQTLYTRLMDPEAKGNRAVVDAWIALANENGWVTFAKRVPSTAIAARLHALGCLATQVRGRRSQAASPGEVCV